MAFIHNIVVTAIVFVASFLGFRFVAVAPIWPSPGTESYDQASSTTTTPTLSISGMKKYYDRSFGLSLWYPANWSISTSSIPDANEYAGGMIAQRLELDENHQSNDLYVDEVLSSTGQFTSPADKGCALTYFFDAQLKQWMQAMSDCDSMPTSTAPFVEGTPYTVGGSRILYGAAQFQTEYIVSLDRHRFVDIHYDGQVDNGARIDPLPLADTIMRLGQVGTAQEKQAVLKEQSAYAER